MSYLNLASIRACTESEGPGKRFALWTQGCGRRCPGCCNPEMQPIRKNHVVDVADVINAVWQARKHYGIEGASFIGGEPILQAEGLADLAEWCQENGLSVLVFTGYLYEELLDMGNQEVDRLLAATDILVDGPYLELEPDEDRDWVGSKNQRVLFLSGRYPKGIECVSGKRSAEFMVSDEGIMINGWPFGFGL